MCTTRLIEPTVAWQISKPVLCKMHAFLQNAISFAFLYNSFVWTNIQALNIIKSSRKSFRCKGYVYLQGTGIEKPDSYVRIQQTQTARTLVTSALQQSKGRRFTASAKAL